MPGPYAPAPSECASSRGLAGTPHLRQSLHTASRYPPAMVGVPMGIGERLCGDRHPSIGETDEVMYADSVLRGTYVACYYGAGAANIGRNVYCSPEPVGGELLVPHKNQTVNCSASVGKLGPGNRLQIFHLLQPNSQNDPPQVQHMFGLGNPALPHQKNSIRFFNLLTNLTTDHPPHNRRVQNSSTSGFVEILGCAYSEVRGLTGSGYWCHGIMGAK